MVKKKVTKEEFTRKEERAVQNNTRIIALRNAAAYDGRAAVGPVVARIMTQMPEARPLPDDVKTIVQKIIEEVNAMTPDAQKAELERLTAKGPPAPLPVPRRDSIPPLEGAEKGKVVMRFAPSPSGPLHLGHARAAILNDEYCRMYDGKFILRLEDTDPERIDAESYSLIQEDMAWLGCKVDEVIIQSDRMRRYYDVAIELINGGKAYICGCSAEDFRRTMKPRDGSAPQGCLHRSMAASTTLQHFERMVNGGMDGVVLMLKTNINDPNPALRDYPILRISGKSHPRAGTKYRAYPLMNFSVAVDDHDMGMTHVLRGKDHLNNTHRQKFIFDYMGWTVPRYIHYGRVRIPKDGEREVPLSKREVGSGISEGKYSGWNDYRLGTLRAMDRRGIRPEAIRAYCLKAGVKEVDVTFSWDRLYFHNKKVIENSHRTFFVHDPVRLEISGCPAKMSGQFPVYRGHPEMGWRKVPVKVKAGRAEVFVQAEDLIRDASIMARLKGLCNVHMVADFAQYVNNDPKDAAISKIIQWCSKTGAVPAEVLRADGTNLRGYAEKMEYEVGKIYHLERIGFARVDKLGGGSDHLTFAFAHK